MTIIQQYAEQIYREINGRSSFTIPILEDDLGLKENALRQGILACPLIRRLAKETRPQRYTFQEGVSLEAFRESLGSDSNALTNGEYLSVRRTGLTGGIGLLLEAMGAIKENYYPTLLDTANTAVAALEAETEPVINLDLTNLTRALTYCLEWIERYELDPRSADENNRWLLFLPEADDDVSTAVENAVRKAYESRLGR